MAQINFPEATANGQTFEAPNGVIYTYVGVPPNGYWSGTFQDQGLQTLDGRYLKLDASNDPLLGNLTIGTANQVLLKTDGDADFAGKVTSAATVASDDATTLVTKGYLEGTGSGTGGGGYVQLKSSTQQNIGTGGLSIAGNTGIGLTSPQAKLHVSEDIRTGSWNTSSSSVEGIDLNQFGRISAQKKTDGNIFEGYLGTTETSKIGSKGNAYFADDVGIGTNSPDSKLHVFSDDYRIVCVERSTAGNSAIQFKNTSGEAFCGLTTNATGWAVNNNFDLTGNSSILFANLTNRFVGIGTTGPTCKLDVYAGSLGESEGDELELFRLKNSNGNGNTLRFYENRYGAGAGWALTSTKIQRRIDSTDQGYIEFGPVQPGIGSGSYDVAIGSRDGEVIRFKSSGNVGVGVNDPKTQLEVQGDASDSILPNNAIFRFRTLGGNGLHMGTMLGSPYESYIQSAFFGSNNNDNPYALLINPAGGHVGIGIDEQPGTRLYVKENSGVQDTKNVAQFANQSPTGTRSIVISAPGEGDTAYGRIGMVDTNFPLQFWTGQEDREACAMTITSIQRVGIGTTSPAYRLHVKGTDAGSSRLICERTGDGDSAGTTIVGVDGGGNSVFGTNQSGKDIYFYTSAASPKAVITDDGDVGIGMFEPDEKLHVDGFIKAKSLRTAGEGIVLTRGDGGNFTARIKVEAPATGVSYCSDYHYFKNQADDTNFATITNVGDFYLGKGSDTSTTNGFTMKPDGFMRIVRTNDVPLILHRLNSDGPIIMFRRNEATVGNIYVTTTGTSYNEASDYRLKENIVNISNGIDRIKNFNQDDSILSLSLVSQLMALLHTKRKKLYRKLLPARKMKSVKEEYLSTKVSINQS